MHRGRQQGDEKMATRIQAITAYRPRIDLNEMVDTEELARYIARGTALNHGEILNALKEFHEAITFFTQQGIPVRIEGLGVFTPSLRLNGNMHVNVRLDPSIRRTINVPGAFKGTILNSGNVGLSMQDLIDRWNEEHPDDPVEE
jgi:hypothetical protein